MDRSVDSSGEGRFRLWMRRLTIAFFVLAILLGAVQTWTSRFAMNTDGIQYLDNATAWWNGDFRHAINSQWSPLYPWLIGGLFSVVRPGPWLEFPLVHLLNFFIYLLSIPALLYLLNGLVARIPEEGSNSTVRRLGLLVIGYSAFLYCSLDLTNMVYVTPDLLVSLFAFLAAGLLLRIAAGKASGTTFIALGLVLGMGYLAKAPFFLYSLLCLAMAGILMFRRAGGLARTGFAVLAFLVVAGPYIGLLSNTKGRLTFGDSGRFNLIWMVNEVPLYNWQGGPPENGTPIHPSRQLSTHPAVFEFGTPIAGTYPLWYDPVYWHEGAKVAMRPRAFLHALIEQLRFYEYLVHHHQLPLAFAFLAVLFLIVDKRRIPGHLMPLWPILVFGAVPFLMYGLIHAEGRYLAPFFVLLWVALFAGLLDAAENMAPRVLLSIVGVAGLLMGAEAVTVTSSSTAVDAAHAAPPHLQYDVAQKLEDLGLKRGDSVAIVSGDLDYYWARMAGARITMQVDFDREACSACGQAGSEWATAKPILAGHGARFVVSPCVEGLVNQPGWQELGTTGIFAYRLQP